LTAIPTDGRQRKRNSRPSGFRQRAFPAFTGQTCRKTRGRRLRWPDRARAANHFDVWTKIAESSAPYAAIFEDDMHLSEGIKTTTADDSWIPTDADIVRLETSTNRLLLDQSPAAHLAHSSLYRLKSTSWCAGGYVLSQKAAKYLIGLPAHYHEPVDAFLFSYEESEIAKKLTVYQFSPALCVQDKYFHDDPQKIMFLSNIEKDQKEYNFSEKISGLYASLNMDNLLKVFHGYRKVRFKA
jgi:glycosyl transferase, family 25